MAALRDQHYLCAPEVKEEVVDCGFVEVDSEDVHQLCTACLCSSRTTHLLDDDKLKQYYMDILTETQLEAGVPVLQSQRLCWECVAHLKRSVRFREQVQDSYRLLQPMLLMCEKEDLSEFLQTSVCRPGRLRKYFAHSIDISPHDDDAQLMTAAEDDDNVAAKKYLENYIEACPSTFRKSVAAIDEKIFESLLDKNTFAVSEDVGKQLEETDTRKLARNSVRTINTPSSTCDTHEFKSTFACDNCFRRFTSKTALERHIATYEIYPHTKTVAFRSECSNKLRLFQHNNMQTNITEKRQCNVKANLLIHNKMRKLCLKPFKKARTALNACEKPFQCEVCQQSFSINSNYKKHLRVHTGKKRFQCDVCKKLISHKQNLIRHMRTHTGKKSFRCERCQKSFTDKRYLKEHMTIHTKPFHCKVCQKSFSRKILLITHIRSQTSEKPFPCAVCQKSFSRKQSLIRHMRTHTGKKPFQCELCQKSFTDKRFLNAHMTIHTKPFHCEMCPKSFSRKSLLITHIRSHTS